MKKIINIFLLLALFAQPCEAIDLWDSIKNWAMEQASKAALAYVGANADPVNYRSKELILQYESYDGKKNKELITAKIYAPLDKKRIRNIILVCHPTTTSNLEVPTGPDQIDKEIRRLVYYRDFTTLVICPDYCGYGISAHKQHPYLIHDVTARNCVDAVVAVLDKLPEWGYTLSKKYKTSIVGYSQGGATALACAKYLDSDACPQEIKDRVKLKQTTCGDGPYSAVATVNQYIEWGMPKTEENKNAPDEDLEYSCVMPLIIAAAKEAYDDGCMKTVNVEDFFDPKFLATGIMDYIKSKSVGTTFISEEIRKTLPRQRPVDVLSDKIIDKNTGKFKKESNEYKCLMRALEKGDLTKGWEPKNDIYFFHLKSDKVVPYVNYEAVRDGIQKDYPDKVHYVDAVTAHRSVLNALLIGVLGHSVLNKAGVDFFDFSKVDHSTGGTIFYTDYMFGWELHR